MLFWPIAVSLEGNFEMIKKSRLSDLALPPLNRSIRLWRLLTRLSVTRTWLNSGGQLMKPALLPS